jgi:hypothetical protein
MSERKYQGSAESGLEDNSKNKEGKMEFPKEVEKLWAEIRKENESMLGVIVKVESDGKIFFGEFKQADNLVDPDTWIVQIDTGVGTADHQRSMGFDIMKSKISVLDNYAVTTELNRLNQSKT